MVGRVTVVGSFGLVTVCFVGRVTAVGGVTFFGYLGGDTVVCLVGGTVWVMAMVSVAASVVVSSS